jgi:acylglycerol lipase
MVWLLLLHGCISSFFTCLMAVFSWFAVLIPLAFTTWQASLYPHIREKLEGIVLTSPALRVKPAHPIVGAVAPIFSLVAPRFQFKGANKRGIPVSRDPAALLAKYSDPLVYTGPIRVRTGHEILRISSHLLHRLEKVTVPFLVLHGTADRVTDPLASRELYGAAASAHKDLRLYDGFLHDLLFEPERDEVGAEIVAWMDGMLRLRRQAG